MAAREIQVLRTVATMLTVRLQRASVAPEPCPSATDTRPQHRPLPPWLRLLHHCPLPPLRRRLVRGEMAAWSSWCQRCQRSTSASPLEIVLHAILQRNREKHRPGRTCINTTRGPSRHCPTATSPAPRSAPSSPVSTSLPLWSCWWATTSCCVRTVLSADRNTCARAAPLVRAFLTSISYIYQLEHPRPQVVYYFRSSRRKKGWKNVHQCQEANADILTAPCRHLTSETLPSGDGYTFFSLCWLQILCQFIGEHLWPVSHCCSSFQAGMNFRKVNRHVDFPLILDMAPFCSAACKVFNYMCIVAKHMYLLACLSVFGLFFFIIPTLSEPSSRWASPLQSVWDCGTQRLHARGPLHCIRQSPPSPEENRAAPQKPVRSGFSCLKHFPACCVCSWKLTVFCSSGIILLKPSIFCQCECMWCSSSVLSFFSLNQLIPMWLKKFLTPLIWCEIQASCRVFVLLLFSLQVATFCNNIQ